jgi:antibiotic biosynthesis monooxygenase (ABM) superfamily enzyme
MDNLSKGVTRIYSRKIAPGCEQRYDDWLARYLGYERQARGYLGTTVIVPSGTNNSNLRYIVHHFTDISSLDEWEKSEKALEMLEEVSKYSTRIYDTATGLETWFKVPDDLPTPIAASPPKWKMAITVFAAAFSASTIERTFLNRYLESTSIIISSAIYTAILVGVLTYFAMPALSKLLRKWLYA